MCHNQWTLDESCVGRTTAGDMSQGESTMCGWNQYTVVMICDVWRSVKAGYTMRVWKHHTVVTMNTAYIQ